LIQSLASREKKLRRQAMRAWRRFERSDAMHDTIEEIRRAGKLSLKPVTSPAPVAENSETELLNRAPIAGDEIADEPSSNHESIDAHSVAETNP
jgi:hypothetical protein